MKREIASYVAKCDVCRRVKAEHRRPAGLLQPLQVPEWKWDKVGMDFITGLPRSSKGHNSIWVIVDHLTKVAHFIPINTTYDGSQLASLYIHRIVSLHEVPKEIVSDRGTQFTSRFWKKFQEALKSYKSSKTSCNASAADFSRRTARSRRITSFANCCNKLIFGLVMTDKWFTSYQLIFQRV